MEKIAELVSLRATRSAIFSTRFPEAGCTSTENRYFHPSQAFLYALDSVEDAFNLYELLR